MAAPVEAKVWGATGGAAAGLALAQLGLAVLNHTLYHDAGVPEDISSPVLVLVPLAVTWLGGWLAPHTIRTDDAALRGLDPAGRHVAGELVGGVAVLENKLDGVRTVNESADRPTFNNGDEDYRRASGG